MNEWEWQLLEEKPQLDFVATANGPIRKGDRVRLKPRTGGDAFDLLLAGKNAIVESLEQDYEGRVHVAVVIEDDPGFEFGMSRQPGHRFFYSVDEIECLAR